MGAETGRTGRVHVWVGHSETGLGLTMPGSQQPVGRDRPQGESRKQGDRIPTPPAFQEAEKQPDLRRNQKTSGPCGSRGGERSVSGVTQRGSRSIEKDAGLQELVSNLGDRGDTECSAHCGLALR